MAVILSNEPIKDVKSSTPSVMKSVKGVLTWNTLLCEHLGKSSDHLLEARAATPKENQSWAEKLLYGTDKYSLNKDFECIKDRDVIADLKFLAQGDPKVAQACFGKTDVPMTEGFLPLNRRSVLDIAQEGLPKLTKKKWTIWYPIIEVSITPCYLALDILTGKIREVDWNTLLCESPLGPQESLSLVRISFGNVPEWRKRYCLTDEFKALKNRDVVSDLRLLLQNIREVESVEVANSICTPSIWEPIGHSTPNSSSDQSSSQQCKERSVLDISISNIPKLKRSNWVEWNALVQDLVTPCPLALDVLNGNLKGCNDSKIKDIEMELFIFLHIILSSSWRPLVREVKIKEGFNGSALYQAITVEMNKSYRQRLKESSMDRVIPAVLFALPSLIAIIKGVYIIPIVSALLTLSTYLYMSHYDTCKKVAQEAEKYLTKAMTVVWLALLCVSFVIAKEVLELFVVMQDQLEYLKIVMQASTQTPQSEGVLKSIYKLFKQASEKLRRSL